MHATCLVCTLKRSPEPSNSEALAEVVLGALRDEGVTTDGNKAPVTARKSG